MRGRLRTLPCPASRRSVQRHEEGPWPRSLTDALPTGGGVCGLVRGSPSSRLRVRFLCFPKPLGPAAHRGRSREVFPRTPRRHGAAARHPALEEAPTCQIKCPAPTVKCPTSWRASGLCVRLQAVPAGGRCPWPQGHLRGRSSTRDGVTPKPLEAEMASFPEFNNRQIDSLPLCASQQRVTEPRGLSPPPRVDDKGFPHTQGGRSLLQ